MITSVICDIVICCVSIEETFILDKKTLLCFSTQKLSQEFYFVALKGHANFQPKLNPAFQISKKEIGQFVSSRPKRVEISYFIVFFCLKSKLPEPKNLHRGFIL